MPGRERGRPPHSGPAGRLSHSLIGCHRKSRSGERPGRSGRQRSSVSHRRTRDGASTRCWNPWAQEITAGLVGSCALIVTLTSPEIPVSCSSSFRSSRAFRFGVRGPGCRSAPRAGARDPAANREQQAGRQHPPRLAIAVAMAATPADSSRAAALPAGRSASPPPGAGFDARPRASAANPAGQCHHERQGDADHEEQSE